MSDNKYNSPFATQKGNRDSTNASGNGFVSRGSTLKSKKVSQALSLKKASTLKNSDEKEAPKEEVKNQANYLWGFINNDDNNNSPGLDKNSDSNSTDSRGVINRNSDFQNNSPANRHDSNYFEEIPRDSMVGRDSVGLGGQFEFNQVDVNSGDNT